MAIDVALLERGEPVVRLYGWDPGCISLGYTQSRNDVDGVLANELGLDVVERPTGGGAIYHAPSELTYAVVLPTGHPGLPADLYASYEHMASGVVEGLRSLGVDASYRRAQGGRDPFCYLREAGVAIVAGGRKISGGAQRRTRRAILQHGTIIVELDADLVARLFFEEVQRVHAGVGSLQDLGIEVSRTRLIEAVVAGYERSFPSDWDVAGPEASDVLLALTTSAAT